MSLRHTQRNIITLLSKLEAFFEYKFYSHLDMSNEVLLRNLKNIILYHSSIVWPGAGVIEYCGINLILSAHRSNIKLSMQ